MKKIIILTIIFFSTVNLSFAQELKKFELKKNSIYLLLLDEDAVTFKNTNPKVLSYDLVMTLENSNQQVILQALDYGSSQLDISTKNDNYSYLVTVSDKSVFNEDDLLEIEKPEIEGIE